MHLRKIALIAIVASFMTAFAGVAAAGPLDTGTFAIYYPDTSTVQTSTNFTNGNSIPTLFFGNINWSLDITGSILTFGFNDSGCCTSSATFSGPIVTFTGGSFPGLTGVTLLSTNIAGFNASRVTFDNDSIFVNVEGGLDLQNNRNVLLAVQTPEPGSYLTMLAGLSLSAFVIWVGRSRGLLANLTR